MINSTLGLAGSLVSSCQLYMSRGGDERVRLGRMQGRASSQKLGRGGFMGEKGKGPQRRREEVEEVLHRKNQANKF